MAAIRKERDGLIKRGLWRDIVTSYQEKLLPISDQESGADLQKCVDALGALQKWEEFDPIVEKAVTRHPENAWLLMSAAGLYYSTNHSGEIIAGEFIRGNSYGRGGDDGAAEIGRPVNPFYRDQIRALQLVRQALNQAPDDATRIGIWSNTASYLYTYGPAWKLQTLTPLETLPDWGESGPAGGTEGAPWKDDAPVIYEVPASWEAAKMMANAGVSHWRRDLV
ncbi:MAG: hypothetical protein HC767_00420 [Akkermansiaceae bacterium]|nr:hypothetical protein [Akkermansiaceae bacterium]